MNAMSSDLPVAVIGAGPVGLAAAARLVERGIRPAVFEKGSRVGSAILEWGHVRVFSPWDYNVDAAARTLLEAEGLPAPSGEYLPTGEEIVTGQAGFTAVLVGGSARTDGRTDCTAIAITILAYRKALA